MRPRRRRNTGKTSLTLGSWHQNSKINAGLCGHGRGGIAQCRRNIVCGAGAVRCHGRGRGTCGHIVCGAVSACHGVCKSQGSRAKSQKYTVTINPLVIHGSVLLPRGRAVLRQLLRSLLPRGRGRAPRLPLPSCCNLLTPKCKPSSPILPRWDWPRPSTSANWTAWVNFYSKREHRIYL